MDRKKLRALQQLNDSIPAHLCGDSSIPCGRRRADGQCNLLVCGYNRETVKLPLTEKRLLAEIYRKGRRAKNG